MKNKLYLLFAGLKKTYVTNKLKRPRNTQSDRSATMTLNSSDSHPKQKSQFLRSIASAPSTPAAPEILYVTYMTSSSEKSRGTVPGTSSYSSKSAHVGFSTGGTCMSGCLSQSTFATVHPVFVQKSSSRKHPPPHVRWPDGPPAADFPT